MLEFIAPAIGELARRIGVLEALPWNPYSPDAEIFDHFAGDGTIDPRWTTTLAGSGTVSLPNTTPTLARLATGATLSSVAELGWSTRYPMVGANKGAEFVARAAITTTPIASCVMFVGFATSGGQYFRIGVIGSSTVDFFVAQSVSGGSATTITPVPYDGNFHLFNIKTFPDRARYYIDNQFVAEHTTNITTSPVQPRLSANNGATATAQTMDVDFVWARESR